MDVIICALKWNVNNNEIGFMTPDDESRFDWNAKTLKRKISVYKINSCKNLFWKLFDLVLKKFLKNDSE